MERAGTARGTVQLRDPVNDGLTIEDQDGFGPDFVDFFNYVDGTGSACADALRNRCQTLVDEVGTSPVFTEPARAVVADSGVQSVLSTPLRDHQGAVRGIVSVHYPQRHARVGDAVLAGLQQLADDCGRWLHWHDAAVMPVAVAGFTPPQHASTTGMARLVTNPTGPLRSLKRDKCSWTATTSIQRPPRRC